MTVRSAPPSGAAIPAPGARPGRSPAVAPVLLAVASGLFLLLAAIRSGPNVTGVDGVHYLVGGLHLVRDGRYVSPSGSPELWFPPLYPLLIGLASLAGRLDPVAVGRAIALISSLLTLALIGIACRRTMPASNLFLGLTLTLLALNPLFEQQALLVLSEPAATLLMCAAFVMWLSAGRGSTLVVASVGVLSGLSYLTRPEGLIPFAIWTAYDCWTRRRRRTLTNYAVAWLLCGVVAMPYLVYLQRQTGHSALSNKLGITLASGRAIYYRCPREFIDPVALEITTDNCRVTAASEMRRYAGNLRRIVDNVYMQAFFDRPMPSPVAATLLILLAYGALCLWRTNHRTAVGLLAQFAVIPIIAALDVKVRYLHMSLPAAAMLIAAACSHLLSRARGHLHHRRALPYLAFGGAPLMLLVAVPLLALRSRGEDVVGLLTRDVGLEGRRLPPGVMYEVATSVAYYADMKRIQLPLNDLETIQRYVNFHHREPTYVVVSTVGRYDPSVSALLSATPPSVAQVLTARREGVTIAVFRLR